MEQFKNVQSKSKNATDKVEVKSIYGLSYVINKDNMYMSGGVEYIINSDYFNDCFEIYINWKLAGVVFDGVKFSFSKLITKEIKLMKKMLNELTGELSSNLLCSNCNGSIIVNTEHVCLRCGVLNHGIYKSYKTEDNLKVECSQSWFKTGHNSLIREYAELVSNFNLYQCYLKQGSFYLVEECGEFNVFINSESFDFTESLSFLKADLDCMFTALGVENKTTQYISTISESNSTGVQNE